jgi:phage terminase small subunit
MKTRGMKTEQAAKKPVTKKTTKKPAAKTKAAGSAVRTRKTVKVQEAVVELTDKQSKFVDEYLLDLNGAQAAIRAGYSEATARQIAAQNLSKLNIQAAIAERRAKQQERTEITADRVLREAWNIATADARELSSVVYECCRRCYGIKHQRQWRDRDEYENTVASIVAQNELLAAEAQKTMPVPSDAGGYGFDPRRDPNPMCPGCEGRGHLDIVIGDSRKLSPAAASLFAGVKQTKFGIEVMTHSKDGALEKLFKHLGLYEKDNQQRVDPLASLLQSISSGNANGFKPVARDPEHGED